MDRHRFLDRTGTGLPSGVGWRERTSARARVVILIVFSLVLAYLIHRFIIRRAFVRLADRSLALLLERRFPEFNDSLVTAVDTRIDAQDDQEATLQQAMLQRAIDEASKRSEDVDTTAALRYGPLLRKAVRCGPRIAVDRIVRLVCPRRVRHVDITDIAVVRHAVATTCSH